MVTLTNENLVFGILVSKQNLSMNKIFQFLSNFCEFIKERDFDSNWIEIEDFLHKEVSYENFQSSILSKSSKSVNTSLSTHSTVIQILQERENTMSPKNDLDKKTIFSIVGTMAFALGGIFVIFSIQKATYN